MREQSVTETGVEGAPWNIYPPGLFLHASPSRQVAWHAHVALKGHGVALMAPVHVSARSV